MIGGRPRHSQGLLICLLGIDGAGKSTQARRLLDRLQAAGYPARYVWGGRRPLITAPLVRLAKICLRAPDRPKATPSSANVPYRAYVHETQRMFRNGLLRELWRQMALNEHALHLWWQVAWPLMHGAIVVCDRYIYDSIINQAVMFGSQLDQALAGLLQRRIIYAPRPDLGFWLDARSHVAIGRKSDIYDTQQLEARIPLYRALATTLGFRRLDASLEAAVLADEIWRDVLLRLATQPLTGDSLARS